MTDTSPLQQPCVHLATPQESDRDPAYQACNAQTGQPCRWATRYDGVVNPPFHSERLEAAAQQPFGTPNNAVDPQQFRDAVRSTGLV